YRSIGVQEWSRSLPFQPWDKHIERPFGTICGQFSKWFRSYVGTLTGSRTEAKRKKDIDQMLERGELLTMEEFYQAFQRYLDEVYHAREHRGLRDAGERWDTPLEVFQNAERYEKAVPPREYAAMLLMKADTARVTNQGINKFKTLYTHYELCHYVGKTVGVKWDVDDVTKLYVFDRTGKKICEAVSAELMQFGEQVSQTALEQLFRDKNRQLQETRQIIEDFTTPYEQRIAEGRAPDVVGKLDLMIGHKPNRKVIQLPVDKEFRGEMAAPRKKKGSGDEFLGQKAEDALSRLRAMNE
ncbi:MAG: Mu transposase C-terminal domain-containing protein, partial [Oscillibacter sp.]